MGTSALGVVFVFSIALVVFVNLAVVVAPSVGGLTDERRPTPPRLRALACVFMGWLVARTAYTVLDVLALGVGVLLFVFAHTRWGHKGMGILFVEV